MTEEEKKAAAELKVKADKALVDAGIDPTLGAYVPGPTPEIDASQIKGLEGVVKGALKSFVEENKDTDIPEEEEDDDPLKQTPTARDSDPLRDAIAPMIQPALDKINLTAQDAKDASVYYATHPEAVKHSKKLEAAFNKMASQGTPQTRESLMEWLKGHDFDSFYKERFEEDAKKAELAKNSQTVDAAGNVIVAPVVAVDENTSDADLEKSIGSSVF